MEKLRPKTVYSPTEVLRHELWKGRQYRGSADCHTTFMQPGCYSIKDLYVSRAIQILFEYSSGYRSIFLTQPQMPYFHWETMKSLSGMTRLLESMEAQSRADFGLTPSDPPTGFRDEMNRDELLVYHYLNRQKSLHNRRILDQYRYYDVKNTADRDRDQVFARICAEGPPKTPPDERPVLMVDQLWLWILQDGE